MSSLHFLNLKGFHPNNKANQRRKWIAEEREKDRKKRDAEALREYEQEQQHFVHLNELEQQQQQQQQQKQFEEEEEEEEINLEGKKKRKRRKKNSNSVEETSTNSVKIITKREDRPLQFMYMPPPGLKSALEKQEKETQKKEEKFDFLKNAPTEGTYTENIKVKHKPFGIEVREVRCMRCGNYGHISGDRECPLKDFNPMDSKRQTKEDPLHSFIKEEKNTIQQKPEQRDFLQKPLLMEPLKEYKYKKSIEVKDSSSNIVQSKEEQLLNQEWEDYIELQKLFHNLKSEENQIIVNKLEKKDLKRLKKRFDKLAKIFQHTSQE